MPDYKEMYLTLFRATEQAINTLIEAQQKCEEMYLDAQEEAQEEALPDAQAPEESTAQPGTPTGDVSPKQQ